MQHISMKKLWMTAGVLIFLITIIAYENLVTEKGIEIKKESVRYKVFSPSQKIVSEKNNRAAMVIVSENNQKVKFSPNFFDISAGDQEDFDKWVVSYLQTHFDHQVGERKNYAFLLPLHEYLKKRFPESWQLKQTSIIRKAFPNNVRIIEELYKKLSDYDVWFKRNLNLMATMGQDEIKEMLWRRREEIFGETAENIWDIDSKISHFNDLIKVFQDASHISLEEKIYIFRGIWDEMREDDDADLAAGIYKYHLVFLDMVSVQSELRRLGEQERHEKLALIREAMGYDQDQIEEKAKLDVYEDRQWDKGRQYMSQREEIVKKYIGVDRENRLRSLRQHYFKGEAQRVAAEEAAHFFRFKQKRIFGRN